MARTNSISYPKNPVQGMQELYSYVHNTPALTHGTTTDHGCIWNHDLLGTYVRDEWNVDA